MNGDLCHACLSNNRKLFPLSSMPQLLFDMKIFQLHESASICWECKGILFKFCKFKSQVSLAQKMLLQSSELCNIKCLSQLSCVMCSDNMEHVYEHGFDPLSDIDMISAKVEIEINGIKMESFDSNFESDDCKPLLDCVSSEQHGLEKDYDKYKSTMQSREFQYENNCDQNTKFRTILMSEEEMIQRRENRRNDLAFKQFEFKCDSCLVGFINKDYYMNHFRKCHSKVINNPKKVCDICEMHFETIDSVIEHRKNHYVYYKCETCDYEHKDLWKMLCHCNSGCTERDSKGLVGSNFEAVTVKPKRASSEKELTCECGFKVPTSRMLYKHRRTCEMCFKFSCEYCGKKFTYRYELSVHEMIHKGMPLLKCDICHKSYRGQRGLKLHMTTHNTKLTEDAYCTECGIQFKNKYLYRTHLKTNLKHVNRADMKYACTHCDKRFSIQSYLKSHLLSHGESKNFVCDVCSHAFKTPVLLRRHVREKHENRYRPKNKICDICGRAFKSKQVLEQHLNSHTGARPYECTTCGANFGYSGALHTHIKLKHKNIKRTKKKSQKKPAVSESTEQIQ